MTKVCRCAYDGVLKGMRMGMGRFSLEGREWRIPGLLYGYDLTCGESTVIVKVMIGHFVEYVWR